jgi:coenzyme F420 biosynthesis associated uncharacterized protein
MDSVPRIDWSVAVAVGRRLTPPGPVLDRAAMASVVTDLKAAAGRAVEEIAAVSGLPGPADSEVLVVDRATWLASNAGMAQAMLAGLDPGPPRTFVERLGARVVGAQAGAVLGFVATRILGQFDPFSTPRRLLLVAPTIVAVERGLGVPPADFRLWVCLHEETHRFQFGAAPWLADHLLAQLHRTLRDLEEPIDTPDAGPGGTVLSPAQRRGVAGITAVMSLLEGHADVMMDRAGERVLPGVGRLRALLEQRRDAPGLTRVVARLLGLSLKREQYRQGAAFCRAVIAAAGVPALNRAFSAPEALPTLPELCDPHRWLARVGEPRTG